MIEHTPEVALSAPPRLAVYENRTGNAVITYDGFTSQLAQYPDPEIAPTTHLVEQKLEAEVACGVHEVPSTIGGTASKISREKKGNEHLV